MLIATVDKCSNLYHFTVSYLNLENANCKSGLHEINITNHIYAIRSYRYYPRYYLIKIKNANNQAKRLILNSSTISKGFMSLCAKRKKYDLIQDATIYKYFASHQRDIISLPFIVEDTMKPYTLLVFMVVAISATVSNHETFPRLNEVLTKAENEIHSKLMRKMMNGAKSSRKYRKKFTAM